MSTFVCFVEYFLVFWGTGVSNVGNFRALETPGVDLGFQGSILRPKTGRKSTLGAPFWDGFGILLGYVFEVLFGRPRDHVFDDFGMVLDSIVGSFSLHFGYKKRACTK